MLKQYDFAFSSKGIENVHSELAVKIHGMLMYNVPDADAKRMHQNKYHPYSLYCVPAMDGRKIITRISSIHESSDIFVEKAAKLDAVNIKGMGIVKITEKGEIFESELSYLADRIKGRRFRLQFITPSVFKVKGNEFGFPDISMHFISVIRRMNEFEGENINFDDFRKALYKCRIDSWQFNSHKYNISGTHIPGMTGYTDILLPEDEDQMMLKKVFIYASFSGTGGRTAMGMGGFFFQEL